MITREIRLLGSRTKGLQLSLVEKGEKPGLRTTVDAEALPLLASYCDERGLSLLVGSRKLAPAVRGFQDKAETLPSSHPVPGRAIVFIARDRQQAIALKAAEELEDHLLMGKLLGYPDCCISFFRRHFQDEAERELSFLKPMVDASRSERYAFVMNVFSRYDDAAVIFHCPCSLDCRETLNMAKRAYVQLEKEDRGIAADFRKRMAVMQAYGGRTFTFA